MNFDGITTRRGGLHRGKMADENEDQWLYGDSVDGKDDFQENSNSQNADNSVNYNNRDETSQQSEATQGDLVDEQTPVT